MESLLPALGVDQHGLSQAEAGERLQRYGRNILPHQPPVQWWQIALRQFRNPLIYILAFAAVLSLVTGRLTDALFIAGVLCLNALIGAIQEMKAERSARALQKLLRIRASVERDGDLMDINAEEVVPGDILWLESGNRVPADLRLLDSHGLEIDESLLTGESLPVAKDPAAILDPATAVADRSNMAHAGSIVVRGRARGLAVATGTATAVGELALDVMGAKPVKPPLIVRMERFTRAIGIAIV
ncbi:MAG: HAD-IC family P-type ATPase, partial [Akkermansiaceae bacterium]|nr:HAD-IC family P-type ATPase [Akkermansiaceae bacterium]